MRLTVKVKTKAKQATVKSIARLYSCGNILLNKFYFEMTMKIVLRDGRGEHNKIAGIKNRDKIVKWIKKNPDATITETCRGTGFSYQTVKKYLAIINQLTTDSIK